jgi:hypothetical protein
MHQKYFTKIFLRQLNLFPPGGRLTLEFVEKHLKLWWKNKRSKDQGGLRLSDEGLDIVRQLDIETYQISFPKNFKITTQVLIQLDQFIDCPYYLSDKYIIVTSEKKAVELTLFSGDVKLFGNAKANRKLREENNEEE